MLLEIILLLIVVAGVLWTLNINSRFMKNYPPGPSPIFPVIGNILQLLFYKRETSYESLNAMVTDFGPLVYVKMGKMDQLIVQDLELARELLSSDYWTDRPFDELIGDRSFGKPLGIIFSSGHNWKEMRRFTTRTLRDFGFGRNKSMESVIDEEIVLVFEKMDKFASSGESLGMHQFFAVSILNILWSMVAGVRFAHDDPKLQKLIKLLDETSKNAPVETNIAQAFPFLWPLAKRTPKMRSRSVFHTQAQSFFRELIDERRDSGSYKDDPKDFIDVFLKEIDHKNNNSATESADYNEEQFIVTLYDLFVAGAETTNNTLEFGMLYMTLNPEVQLGVREEIHRVVGRNRRPNLEDKPLLPYTEGTLLEIQRMASIIPLLVRSASEDTTLSGYNLPKGTTAVINLFGINHSKTWGDPENFRPSRFLAGRRLINAHKILPFGLGKRICLGESLAKASLFNYFTAIMQQYKIVPADASKLPSSKHVNGFTLSTQEYFVRLEKINE